MTPALRLAMSLVVSLLLWLPSLPGAVAAEMPPEMIALRYLLALVVSRIGVGLVFRIFNAYAAGGEAEAESDAEDPHSTASPASDEPVFGRRADDWVDVDAEVHATDEELLESALDEATEAAALVS